jgi:hypothetical protein
VHRRICTSIPAASLVSGLVRVLCTLLQTLISQGVMVDLREQLFDPQRSRWLLRDSVLERPAVADEKRRGWDPGCASRASLRIHIRRAAAASASAGRTATVGQRAPVARRTTNVIDIGDVVPDCHCGIGPGSEY